MPEAASKHESEKLINRKDGFRFKRFTTGFIGEALSFSAHFGRSETALVIVTATFTTQGRLRAIRDPKRDG